MIRRMMSALRAGEETDELRAQVARLTRELDQARLPSAAEDELAAVERVLGVPAFCSVVDEAQHWVHAYRDVVRQRDRALRAASAWKRLARAQRASLFELGSMVVVLEAEISGKAAAE